VGRVVAEAEHVGELPARAQPRQLHLPMVLGYVALDLPCWVRIAQQSLSAELSWPTVHRDQTRTLTAAKLVPKARQGLVEAGVAAAEADRLLEVISGRPATGQTGAAWQRATLAAAERGHDREHALAVMLRPLPPARRNRAAGPHLSCR